jgi:hypothetical protein
MSSDEQSDAPLELAPIHEALLDAAWLTRLEEDLATVASIEQVLPRPRDRSLVPPASIGIREAFAALRAGAYVGLQVRYSHAGEAWCDTLLVRPEGVKLVRMRQPGA